MFNFGLHITQVCNLLRSVPCRTYSFVTFTVPQKARSQYKNVKSVASAYRRTLKRKRRKDTRAAGSWSKRKKKTLRAVMRPLKRNSELQTPVPHLLTSNDPADDEETSLIHNALEDAETKLKACVNELEMRRRWNPAGATPPIPPPDIARLEQHISQLKSTTSALRRFPPELLQDIFIFGLYPRYNKPAHYYPSDDIAYPWTLSHVCRHWRNTALCTPEIWSYLPPVTIKHFQLSKELHMQYDMIKLMIQRSKDRGLHVVVSGTPSRRTPLWSPCCDLLVQNSERWETAAFNFSQSQLVVFTGIKGRISRLKHLYLVLWSCNDDGSQLDRNMFFDAPQLQKVDFFCYTQRFAPEFPAAQLKHFALQSSNLDSHPLQTVSANVDTLQTLSLGSGNIPPLPAMLTLPNVTNFSLRSASFTTDISGVDNLTLPALEEFFFSSDHPTILNTALALLQRSSQASTNIFSLKKLGIGDDVAQPIESSPDTLVEIFQLVSSLQYLQCPLPPLALLLRLSEIEPERVLLPLLEHCALIIGAHISGPDARAVNQIAITRCELPMDDNPDDCFNLSVVKRLRYFSVESQWGGQSFRDDMTRSHYTLENSWTATRVSVREGSHDDALADQEADVLEGHQNMATMDTLTRLMGAILTHGRRFFGNPASQNPFSKRYISRRNANRLASHLSQCMNEVTIQDLAASRIQGYEYSALRRCLKDTPALTKKANPHLQRLEKAFEDMMEAWTFMLDEKLHLVHWVYDSTTYELIYFPMSDGLRIGSQATALVLDLDYESYCLKKELRYPTKELVIPPEPLYSYMS